jgi:toxin ParE1/3/4
VGQTRSVRLRYTLPALAVIDLLLLHLDIGRRTSDPAIRRMTVMPYPYLVFYEVTESEIIIHAIRHAARDPSGMPGST